MTENLPRFYFTVHPGDLMRSRLIRGSSVMLVASAFWSARRGKFDILRPFADHLASFCIDSGGFTAARRWGCYPWSVAEYVNWIRAEKESGLGLDFCAVLDYACEPSVDRSTYATNTQRIDATIANEQACREAAPDLPWLPVLQGDSLEERAYDLEQRARLGLLPAKYAGIGSVCGRGVAGAVKVLRFYAERLPGVRFHAFGLHVGALDDDRAFFSLASWDSYGWNWGRDQSGLRRPAKTRRRAGESWSEHTRRLAEIYLTDTILPRLERERQLVLW